MYEKKTKSIKCPSCGLDMICTNKQLRLGQICRYRLCRKCNAKFATIEKNGYEHIMYEVNKKKLVEFI